MRVGAGPAGFLDDYVDGRPATVLSCFLKEPLNCRIPAGTGLGSLHLKDDFSSAENAL